MSLTSDRKAMTLERLHLFFNHTDEYPAEPGRPLEFSEQIQSDIKEITNGGLHKNVIDWGKFCSDAREESGYTQEQVAELLDVTHRAIQRQERKNVHDTALDNTHKKALVDIDPFYLEAFSLIYNKSPYELLGLKSPHLACPTMSFNDRVFKYSDLIITTLFDTNDPEKLAHLETITKIGKLKLEKYRQLISILKDTTAISRILEIEPLDHLPENHNRWRKTQHPFITGQNLSDPEEYQRWYVFCDAHHVLDDLERHNPIRLRTLAQLALCDAKSAKALRSFIFDIGFPKDAKSLHNYHVDKLLSPPQRRRKKKSTSVAGKYVLTSTTPVNVNKEIQSIVFYCPNRSLTGILEEGQVLVHNNSSHSTIHGASAKLTEFLLGLNYTPKGDPSTADDTIQVIGAEKNHYEMTAADVIYRINLQDGHIYSHEGIATLTESQSHDIQQIIESVFSEGVYRDTLPLFYERRFILQNPEENA